ncbi:plasminogen receptor (KT)-like [Oratosquilla oratoria]|uniref:plasminogen receptor (KT)-like n=1 Tax=Oratosquilla oratoria TaxID=337810 RepID=UPI003F76C9DD
MGNQFTAAISEEMEKNKDFVLRLHSESAGRTQEAVRCMAERQMAIQVAATRERLEWFLPFSMSSAAFLYYQGYVKTKSPVVMFPLIPMAFAFAWQLDFAYGNKGDRVKEMAERIMLNEAELLAVPDWKQPIDKATDSRSRTLVLWLKAGEILRALYPSPAPAHCLPEDPNSKSASPSSSPSSTGTSASFASTSS